MMTTFKAVALFILMIVLLLLPFWVFNHISAILGILVFPFMMAINYYLFAQLFNLTSKNKNKNEN